MFCNYFIFSLSISMPCLAPGGVANMETSKNMLVFVGRKPYAPFSRNAGRDRISEYTRSKNQTKNDLKNNPHGNRQHTF